MQIGKGVPIFKNETSLLHNNYRPVSLLSDVGKISGKLVHKRLIFFHEQCNCYYPFQFGFRSNCSTNSTLMSVVENIKTEPDKVEFGASVFVDQRKT